MSITLHNKEFEISIPSVKIQSRVQQIADAMNNELAGKDVMFIGILNGSFMFASDVFRRMKFDCRITFLKLASYEGTSSSGHVKQLIGLNDNLKGKTIVILEDIIDTGITMESIIKQLMGFDPAEIKVATFLFKPSAFKKEFKIDYIGFDIPNDFIVGYGLDYDGLGRNYEDIYSIVKSKKEFANMKNILLFGAPGAGKGTQSKKIIEKFNLVHLSTGDILRSEIQFNSNLGKLANQYISKGELVPDELVIQMIGNRIEMYGECGGFVIDGFPRTIPQAEALEKMMKDKNMSINVMLALKVPDEILRQRLEVRSVTEGRKDDTPDIINNRIRIYNEKTAKVANFYQKQGRFAEISGVQTIEDIFKQICDIIENS